LIKVDVWAVGIMLYALLVGRPPFESDTVDETYRRIRSNQYDFPKQIPVSNEAKTLIKHMLDPNPRTRATMQQIRSSEFLMSQKIPSSMPAYTISLPPQSSFLKQYGG
jgi:polo-like kinase 1